MPDVAEGEGAEDGVAEGVDGDVAVGMGYEALVGGNLHPAEPHRKPGSEGVYVVSVADFEVHNRRFVAKVTIKFVFL
jgi:hypothetical protein